MNYATLEGTIDALDNLLDALNNVKTKCNEEVMESDKARWDRVGEIIEDLRTKLYSHRATLIGYGSQMSNIASEFESS